MAVQTIGHDKVNQLRHVRFFVDNKGMEAHMKKHADLIRPKFEALISIMEEDVYKRQILYSKEFCIKYWC